MNARLLALALLLPLPALAQGFAGMAGDAEGFTLPAPGPFDFPADHGPHPDFRIEWWYVTANLEGPDGTPYGAQWTLFRAATAPGEAEGWQSPQIWFAHAALTTPEAHHATERFARGGIGQAGVTAEPFAATIDEWQLAGPDLNRLEMRAAGPDFAYRLELAADRPPVPQGEEGYSVKSADGQASRYYSQPFYTAEGTLTLPEGEVPVTGVAWLDREWSSQPLSPDQSGWDWFSLHLEGGAKLMGYRIRSAARPPYTVATWIDSSGIPTPYEDGALTAEPLREAETPGARVPVAWRLTLPARALDVTVEALNPAAWNPLTPPYWEGPVTVTGTHPGRGYLEMTGY